MERVLVCLLASTRAHQLTFPSFKRQVLDELNADLALALLIDDKYDYSNPFWQHAKYRWTAPTYSDYGEAFDFAQRSAVSATQAFPRPTGGKCCKSRASGKEEFVHRIRSRALLQFYPFAAGSC